MAVKQSTQRAKFAYIKRDEIQKLINAGKIDANDIIYTNDSHENIFIGADLSVNPVRSKIYRFPDEDTAKEKLNESSDTYAGQLIAILNDGTYKAYIVNKNQDDKYYISCLSDSTSKIDYDSLGNKPIDSLNGTLDNPVTISELDSGIYKVKGQYKVCSEDTTTYLSTNDNIFIVGKNEDSTISIKKITSLEITDYKISENQIESQTTIPTKEWIKEQGYATETYVNEKIAALDFITKDEVQQYVTQVINAGLDSIIDEKIDTKLNESFAQVKDSDINTLF